jgi:hypothetical protein
MISNRKQFDVHFICAGYCKVNSFDVKDANAEAYEKIECLLDRSGLGITQLQITTDEIIPVEQEKSSGR